MDREHELLGLAVSIAREAAALARAMRTAGVDPVATKSTLTDVVTAADRAVERQVREAIRAARPGDSVLGEEFGTEAGGGRRSAGSSTRSTAR
ncbi:hypothetical protein GCM10027610_138880 [Dactylosporangium cerinum]